MRRYAARLLFQFRVNINGDPGKMRICEERILNLQSRSAPLALRQAKRRGKAGEFKHENSDGNMVYFEFIGIVDFMELGPEAASDEVWYDIYDRLEPMERRDRLVPADEVLLARVCRT